MINFEFTIINPKKHTEMYVISKDKRGNLWIEKGDGEGGEFNEQKFYDAIDKFYKDNF